MTISKYMIAFGWLLCWGAGVFMGVSMLLEPDTGRAITGAALCFGSILLWKSASIAREREFLAQHSALISAAKDAEYYRNTLENAFNAVAPHPGATVPDEKRLSEVKYILYYYKLREQHQEKTSSKDGAEL